MKIPWALPSTPKSKATRIICGLITGLGLLLFLAQTWRIHAMWTPVGFVDTWPLYDRLMKWRQGQLTLDHYLFDPQGPHLHFIIFLLYLIDVLFGSGRQLVPHFATIFSICGIAATLCFLVIRSYPTKTAWTLQACALIAGVLILLSGVSEATVIPFQAVVVVTRFIHFALLGVLAWCEFFPNRRLHLFTLAISCVAATFYAAGGIFAIEILLLHLICFRNWRPLLWSWLPLACYFWFMVHYVKPTAEITTITSLLRQPSVATLREVIIGTICYYGSALAIGWPSVLTPTGSASELTLLAIATMVGVISVAWAIYILVWAFFRQKSGTISDRGAECTDFIIALLSLFVFTSAVSAALLWVARARIFGPALGIPAHFAVLTATRYAAFAAVAFCVVLYILHRARTFRAGSALSAAMFILIAGVAINSLRHQERYISRNPLEDAATALLMGMSPADAEAAAVWPGVKGDWYWPGELPKTAAYINAGRFSYAYGMPALGQISGRPSARIFEYAVEPVPESGTVCRIWGTMASFEEISLIAPQRFFPITSLRGDVVGYAARNGTSIRGHLNCNDATAHPALFLSEPQ